MKKYNLINNTLGWLCFVISAVTYLLTIEPTASFWDCPEFISQGAKLEVGHPPGNPIFMLTARFFVTIFGGGIKGAAIAVNSMSALFSAATILLLFWTITHLVKKIVVRDDADSVSLPKMIVIMGAGICGALAYTWSDTFWFSAVEGEVYAFSSFCTALVFWLILKWENKADQPHSDRYLVLIAYVIGVSIAVHLLNLLCIPAIVLVFYYRKYKDPNAKGSLIALAISFVLVGVILYGLVPGFIKVAQGFELFFVNTLHMSYNVGVLIYAIVLLAAFIFTIYALYSERKDMAVRIGVMLILMLSGLTFVTSSVLVWCILFVAAAAYLFYYCRDKIPYRIFTVSVLSILVIFVGYSSYALLLIRASADTPMNQNAPDNVFTLSSYLNREQYGKNPLFYGPVFTEQLNIQRYDRGDGTTIGVVMVDDKGVPLLTPAETTMYRYEPGKDGKEGGYMPIDNGEFKYTKVVKTSPDQRDEYVPELYSPDYKSSPDVNMLFTRMYSTAPEHIQGYKNWSMYENPDIANFARRVPQNKRSEWASQKFAYDYEVLPYFNNLKPIRLYEDSKDGRDNEVFKPTFADNLRYFLNYQLNHMYWRYFMWNFAGRQNDLAGNGEPHLGNWISGIPFIDNARLGDQSLLPDEYGTGNKGHNVFYMLPLLMGLIGLLWQSLCHHRANPRRGIEQFWVVFFLFFMTGIAIVLYLNQTPGQPRERDYAFAGSFYAFAIWIGMGVPAISYFINELFAKKQPKDDAKAKDAEAEVQAANDGKYAIPAAVVAAIIGLIVPLQMVSQTWDDHDRSHRYTTRDFGENYLNSLDENAIIFTNGDNDTFPLWYAQEVEGVRTDVRVVNLSYLSTDWYANQLRHPYYDAAAVKMLAQPKDYGYDKMSYSVSRSDGSAPVPALEGLKEFYESDFVQHGNMAYKELKKGKMYAPIDTAKMYKAFNLDPNSTDSVTKIPYLSDIQMNALGAGSFYLNKLLSFDIVATAVNDGFEHPVYFASTVPDSYYLGLAPYLNTTGLAYQVTPFTGAEASPMVDKAYENIVSKYRWGGLDDPEHNQGLYLDETIRRMVASVRNSMIETAEDLYKTGDLPATDFAKTWAKEHKLPILQTRYDMARYMLNLMEEKLPQSVVAYDMSTDVFLPKLYLDLYSKTGNPEDLKRAEALVDKGIDRYGQLARYASSIMDSFSIDNLGYTGQVSRFYLPMFIAFKNYIQLYNELNKNPEQNADLLAMMEGLVSPDLRIDVYPYLYLRDWGVADFEEALSYGYPEDDFTKGLALATLHQATGLDKNKVTKEVLAKYGLTVADMMRLNPYIRQ